ncbi:MAG: helix-turn-helix domain-containing protein [Cetobacterium sp.]
MYLNSKHIQIALVIKKSNVDNYKVLSKLLDITPSSFFSYIRDIEKTIYNESNIDIKILIKIFKEDNNLIYKMKKLQSLTKEERIVFIIFKLLNERFINISKVAEQLNVTRRTLNYDLEKIKLKLSTYNLSLDMYKNLGLVVSGDEVYIRRMFLGYIIKHFIEKDFLPKIMRDQFGAFLKQNNFKNISKATSYIESKIEDSFYYNQLILNSSILSFSSNIGDKQTIKFKITDSFEVSILEDLSWYFSSILNNRCYTNNFLSEKVEQYKIDLEKILSSFFDFKFEQDIYDKIPLKKWIIFLIVKEIFEIKDNYFMNILIDDFPENIFKLTNKIKNKIPATTIYEGFIIYFFMINIISLSKEEKLSLNNYIFVYKNIPSSLISVITKKLEKLYSIKFKNTVKFNNLKNYIKHNKPTAIYSIEEFDFNSLNIKHIKVALSDFFMF